MTRNRSYLTDYEEFDGGFVAFGGNSKGGKITGKGKIRTDFKLTDESHVLLKVPRKDNMYSVDLNNVVSQGGHTCLFVKATSEESNLWHRRLEHDSLGTGFKPSMEEEKKDVEKPKNEESEVPITEEPRDNVIDENIVYGCDDDPNMPDLEEIGRFSDAENDDSGPDFNNLDTIIYVSLVLTTRVHKDHPVKQIIGDLTSAPQTRRMTKQVQEHSLVYRNMKDERGIVISNKARLVAQGHTKKEGIDYDAVFAPVARIEKKYKFCQPPSFEDPNFLDSVYIVEKALYGLHQAPRAWYETLSTYLLKNGFQSGKIDKTLFIKRDKSIVVANSTTEAEYIAASNSSGQKQKPKKSKKKNTKVPQLSGSTNNVADENVTTTSNDPLLNGEDRLQLNELMDLCTKLQKEVLNLKEAKTTQAKEIASLMKRVKKLEKKRKSTPLGLKRLRKVGSARRIESSNEAVFGDHEDASKQERKINDIDADAEVTLIDETQGRNDNNLMFDISVLDE
nr:hypothetical protein [Tanacetum cinerariifolium]